MASPDPAAYYEVKDALEAKGYSFVDSTLGPVPLNWSKVEDEEIATKLETMLEKFDENDDVQEVFNNWDN